MSEQIALVFCKLINKNVLEWFLLIIKHTLDRSTNLFSRNQPTLCFWLGVGWQMPNAEQLLYATEKSSHQRFSIKKFLKILQYSRENTVVKLLKTPILKNICIQLLLNWLLEVTVWKFFSFHSKPSWLSNITK